MEAMGMSPLINTIVTRYFTQKEIMKGNIYIFIKSNHGKSLSFVDYSNKLNSVDIIKLIH